MQLFKKKNWAYYLFLIGLFTLVDFLAGGGDERQHFVGGSLPVPAVGLHTHRVFRVGKQPRQRVGGAVHRIRDPRGVTGHLVVDVPGSLDIAC